MLSKTYKEQLRKKHATQKDWGTTGGKHFLKLLQLMELYDCKSVLDFGCGKGLLGDKYREAQKDTMVDGNLVESGLKNIPFYEYDPGVEGKDKTLCRADMVICTDVLEHIEPSYLDEVLRNIADKTNKLAYFVICCRPAGQNLPDGRNAHLIVQQPDWWEKKLLEYFSTVKGEFVEYTKEYYVTCRNPK